MVKCLGKYGGDIIKFVGDAMIVMWPRTSSACESEGAAGEKGGAETVVRKAIQCALDIQKELNNKKIMSNVTNLSVKVSERDQGRKIYSCLDWNRLWSMCFAVCRRDLQPL
jgi:hypothetical protein